MPDYAIYSLVSQHAVDSSIFAIHFISQLAILVEIIVFCTKVISLMVQVINDQKFRPLKGFFQVKITL